MPKLRQEKASCKHSDMKSEIITAATRVISAFEGMKIMRADKANDGWQLKYITISDAYPISRIEKNISEVIGETVVMINLNYDFETAAALLFR